MNLFVVKDGEAGTDIVAGDDPRRPLAVLVTGMHASGTAEFGRCIALLHKASAAESPDRENGRFPHIEQSSAVTALNQRILQEIGDDWRKPSLLFLHGKSVAESRELIRGFIHTCYLDLAVGVARSGAAADPLILEDPGLCQLHDLWQAALERVGYRVHTVLAARNPLEVAAALKTSHRLANNKALQAWVQHDLALLTTASRDQALTVMPYADLLRPERELAGLLRTRLNWPAADEPDAALAAEWPRLSDQAERGVDIPDHVVARSPLVPSLVKRLYALLMEWQARDGAAREAELTELAAVFEDQSLFTGNLVEVKLPEPAKLARPAVASGAGEKRKVLIHYHLFKNAGTSVDAILRRNFGHRWVNTEFPPRSQADHQQAIQRLILDNPNLAAISSHTLMLPVPEIEGVEIFPILFVRHPLDRLKSAYEFERQQAAATVGSELAKEWDFAGYLKARLAIRGDRACRDFHVYRLAMAVPAREGTERERALIALDRLPFVGLVEAFGPSAQALQERVQVVFPDFQSFESWENSGNSRQRSLEERVDAIRRELGEECFLLATEANQGDMNLYHEVRQRYSG